MAAGSGTRLGADRPKALVELGGRALFTHALESMLAARSIGQVVIAAPPERTDEVRNAASADDDSAVEVVAGGVSRSESVRNALAAADADLVAVHDAARPFAPPALFDRAVRTLAGSPAETGAVIAAAKLADTVKEAAEDEQQEAVDAGAMTVARTLDRSRLWAAQTPQVFRAGALREALSRAENLEIATDDAMLIETAGLDVRIVESSTWNFKVTTPADLEAAERLLDARLG